MRRPVEKPHFLNLNLKHLCIKILAEDCNAGLVPGKTIIADATLIAGDASIDSMVERSDADPEARALKTYEKRYHDFKTGKKTRQKANQAHVSLSDPDANLPFVAGVSDRTLLNQRPQLHS